MYSRHLISISLYLINSNSNSNPNPNPNPNFIMPCLALIPFTAEQFKTIQVLILRGAFHDFPFYRYGPIPMASFSMAMALSLWLLFPWLCPYPYGFSFHGYAPIHMASLSIAIALSLWLPFLRLLFLRLLVMTSPPRTSCLYLHLVEKVKSGISLPGFL